MAQRKNIMLCLPFEEKRLLKWQAPFYAQPKLDGVRCLAYFDHQGRVTLSSSSDIEQISVPHVITQLEKLRLSDLALDGELYIHGVPFQQINSIVSRKQNMHPNYHRISYHIFDYVNCVLPQHKRFKTTDILKEHIRALGLNSLRVVPYEYVENTDEIFETCGRYIDEGYEGIIVRNPAGLYEVKRSSHIMKYKPRKGDSYLIYGFREECDQYGNPKARLGALLVRKDGIDFAVGSGPALDASGRDTMWLNRQELIGKYANIKYQEKTESGKCRFPILFSVTDQPEY